jgi:Spy/CpxP family protein refolding chaperone
MMQESLGLTDDQVQQLEPILEQQRKELSAFRRETSLSRQERKARLDHMRETQEAQLQSVLTPEQFEQWRKGPPNLHASQQQEPELWITTHPTNATSSPSR